MNKKMNFKHRALMALLLVTTLAAIPIMANAANDSYTIIGTDGVATIGAAIQTKLNTMSAGDVLTVTGSKTDANVTLNITIPAGVTVKWNANYAATIGITLIALSGDGAFEVVSVAHSASLLALQFNQTVRTPL